MVLFPPGQALVQTLDFFTPVVNDPYRFGQIAAANSLSDVYAMGGTPLSCLNIVCFPLKTMDKDVLKEILRGGHDKIKEAGALLVGGHSVEDPEIKYGLSVSGVVSPDRFARNGGLVPGDEIILTKPIGTGVLATALKAGWAGGEAIEETLWRWAGRLNKVGGQVIAELGLKAATDITGFGLGGHLLEMAVASGVVIELDLASVPIIDLALDLAAYGLIPEGSHANRLHCQKQVRLRPGLDPLRLELIFDAQTSGGLALAVPPAQVESVRQALLAGGDGAVRIGRVLPAETGAGLSVV